MATKDWKNLGGWSQRNKWQNKKTKKEIYIVHNEGFTSWRFGDYGNINKTFKNGTHSENKLQAIKFARAYMRKH